MAGLKKILKRLKKVTPVYIPVYKNSLLEGKTALITGGSRGIGFAIAESFLDAGAQIIICGRDQDALDKAKKQLCIKAANNNSVDYCVLDLTKIDETRATVLELVQRRSIDILVNNAGVSNKKTFDHMTEAEYDLVMDTNLKGVYFLSQTIAEYMIKNQVKGNILNIGSSSGKRPATLPYTLSKWGIQGLTEGLAKKLIKHDIVVNGIAPGQTYTSMIRSDSNDLSAPRAPIGRLISPHEIGNMAVIMVSGLGRSIVGDTVFMTGGSGILTFDDIDY